MNNKQKNKSDFLVNGQPSYAKEVRANQKAVGYNLGKAEASLIEQQKKLLEQQQLIQLQTAFMMQKEDEFKKLLSEVQNAIQQMPMPASLPPEAIAQQLPPEAIPMGGPPMGTPMGGPPMPPPMGMM